MSVTKIDFIGIGVMKSATTWIYSILEDHEQVNVSCPKELDYFSREHNYSKGDNWYHKQFDINGLLDKNMISGEISPSYMHNPLTPFRVQKYNKDIKIIVALRDPIKRAFSNHLHLVRRNVVKGSDLSFEYGLERFQMYIEQSKYYAILKPWFEVFPRENILVIIQEDIKKDPVSMSKKIYNFLNINNQHVSDNLFKKANVSKTVRSHFVEKTLKLFASIFNLLGFGRLVSKIKKNRFLNRIRSKNTHIEDDVPEIKKETILALQETLSEDVLNLQKLLGLEKLPWGTWEYAKTKNEK